LARRCRSRLAASGASLEVGRWNGLGRYLDGSVANLSIWSLAKSASQIAALANVPYASMSADQRTGIQQAFPLSELSGPRIDAVSGAALADPTGVTGVQLVTGWQAQGALPADFSVSPNGQAPVYVPHFNMNGQPALSFTGLSAGPVAYGQALKYTGPLLPNDNSGDVFIVAEFSGDVTAERLDTLFSSASDTTAVDYQFFALYNVPPPSVPADQGGGRPHIRLRYRDDTTQDDIRGQNVLESNAID
jgi:hypothetical protein